MSEKFIIRVMTPATKPLDVVFNDVVAEEYPFGKAVVLNLKDLEPFAFENKIAFDTGMLSHMLDKSDPFHTYTKTPCKDKRNAS